MTDHGLFGVTAGWCDDVGRRFGEEYTSLVTDAEKAAREVTECVRQNASTLSLDIELEEKYLLEALDRICRETQLTVDRINAVRL